MKKLILAIACTALIGGAGATFAQGQGPHHQRGEYMQHMLSGIDATDAQRQQIKSILEGNRTSMTSDREQLASAKKALRALDPMASNYKSEVSRLADQIAEATRQKTIDGAAVRAQVAAVLTPEQRASLKAHHEARMEQRQDRWQKSGTRPSRKNAG